MSIGIGVIGLGMMGKMYSEIFLTLENARLVGCADIDEQRLKDITSTCGIQGYTDYRDLLARDDLDAVAICTPDQMHLDFAVTTARKGKHMLIEKPLATKIDEAEAIISEAENNGVILTVGHLLRFESRYVQAKEAVETGAIGEVVYLNSFRRSAKVSAQRLGGRTSVAFYLGVHDIDIMNWIANDDVETVYALGTRKIHSSLGVDDVMIALLHYKNGITGSIELSWAMHPKGGKILRSGLLIAGTQGTVELEVDSGLCITTDSGPSYPDAIHWPVVEGVRLGALREELRRFVDCVKTGAKPLVSPQDALKAVKIASAIEESIQVGAPVQLHL